MRGRDADVGEPDVPDDVPSLARRRYLLIVLVGLYTVSMIDRTIINTLAQQIKQDLGLSDTQLGLLTGIAFAFLYATMSFPLARLAETRSRLNLIATTLTIWSVMTALCGVAGNFWQLCAARLGVGVGEAGFTPAAHSMISDSFSREQRSTAMSVYSLGVPVGTFLGAALGGWIGQMHGWRSAFLIVGLPGLLLAILTKATLREPRRGAFDAYAPALTMSFPFRTALRVTMSDVRFLCIVAGFTFAAFAGYSLGAFFVAFLQRAFAISLLEASSTFGLITGGSGIVGMIAGGILSDRLSRRDPRMQFLVPALSLLIAAPLMIAAVLQSRLIWLWPIFALGSVLYPIYVGCGFAAAHNLFPPRLRATATSLLLMISTLVGMGIGPVATGMVSDAVAHRAFAGDFDVLCRTGAQQACMTAQTTGLRAALVCALSIYILAGLSFLVGGLVRPPRHAVETDAPPPLVEAIV